MSAADVSAQNHVEPAELHQVVDNVGLHAEVHRHDLNAAVQVGCFDGVVLRRRDGGDQVDAVGAGLGFCSCEELGFGHVAERSRQCPGGTDQPCQTTRVDPCDSRHTLLCEHGTEVALGAEVAVAACEVANNDASAKRSP